MNYFRNDMSSLLSVLFVLSSFVCVTKANSPPMVTGWPANDFITLKEDYNISKPILNLTIKDTDNDIVTITMDQATKEYIRLSKTESQAPFSTTMNLIKNLDRETMQEVKLEITLTDSSTNYIIKQLAIYVDDVNDNAPVFQNLPYTWEIKENATVGLNYTSIQATDADTGNYGTVRYSMEPVTQSSERWTVYNSTFSINPGNGTVVLKKPIDYETNNYYQFSVSAKDGGGRITTNPLIIRVKDVQDTHPFFDRSIYQATIQEEIQKESFVINVHAIDGDRGVPNGINYSISNGTCKDMFYVSQSGSIRTKIQIDRDVQSFGDSDTCKLVITATENNSSHSPQFGSITNTTSVYITVTDRNDNPPKFTPETAKTIKASIAENSTENSPVPINISITDIDQGKNAQIGMSIDWPTGTCEAFKVVPTTIFGSGKVGITVKNKSCLDYETVKQINFTIVARDSFMANLTASIKVIVDISDVNDNAPTFGNITTTYSINENSENGTDVATIIATDKDSTSNGQLKYDISGGNGRFVVNQTTGEIRTHCQQNCTIDFDRERYSEFTLSYIVRDEGGLSDLRSITIKLNDTNDNVPQFYRSHYKVFIEENDGTYETTPLITLDATDKDETKPNNQVTFTKLNVTGVPASNVSLNSSLGQLFLNSPVDYEKLNTTDGTIRLIVGVKDNGIPSKSSSTSVVVTVQDLNDNAPIFEKKVIKANISEDKTSNTTLKTIVTTANEVKANDADGTGRNKDFNYFIIKGAFEKFAIDQSTGLVSIQINAKLDREVCSMYNITLNAIDQGSPSKTGTATLEIAIEDVNDKAPTFEKHMYAANIAEDKTNGTVVKKVKANDTDIDNELIYSITNVTARDEDGKRVDKSKVMNYFDINATTGEVFVKSILDRETAKTVLLELLVKDMKAIHNKPQTATAVLDITILDVNDNLPIFQNTTYSAHVPENAPNPDIIDRVHAVDVDENRTITYELVQAVSAFKIAKKTGDVIKDGSIDRETKASYTLNISATDSGVPPKTSYVTVNVNVTDVNDNPPIFSKTTYVVRVPEDINVSTHIIKMNASDIDIGRNAEISFSISSGNNGNFAINSTTGWISITNNLDRETLPSYNLVVTAKDNPKDNTTQKSSSATLSIIVNDVNDNPPSFEESYYETSRPENVPIGTTIITLIAKDRDKPKTNNSEITYRFVNNSDLFRIDQTLGVVTVKTKLKDQVGNYTVIVQASDNGTPRLTNNTTLMIKITDVNQHEPIIGHIPSNNAIGVYECIEVDKIFWSFNFTDGDLGLNAEALFNIKGIGENVNDSLKIYQNGSLVVKKELDENTKNIYKFQVTATDLGDPPLSSKAIPITLNVLDVNNHPPEFTNGTISTSISENQKGILVATVEAIDKDSKSNSCYSLLLMNGIENSTWDQFFNISEPNGEIYNIQEFDYEDVKAVTLVVHVRDCSLSVHFGDQCKNRSEHLQSTRPNITIHIEIIDVDDNPPIFLRQTISTGMRRTAEPGSVLKLQLRNNETVNDDDSLPNGLQAWQFTNNGEIVPSSNLKDINTTSGINSCGNKTNYIFCIEANGTITNNKYFSEDLYGYFEVPIIVYDKGGNDTAIVKIDLIGDSQILIMTVLDTKEVVSTQIDQLLKAYSGLLGQTFVYDGLEDHKEGDTVYSGRSDLYFHIRAKDGNNVMSAKEAEILLDQKANTLTTIQRKYHITTIKTMSEKALNTSDPELKFYVLLAIVAVLTLTLILIIVASMVTRNKYRRKVKAATVQDIGLDMIDGSMNIPGSNQFCKQANPLLNAKVEKTEAQYDTMSHKSNDSLDSNVVDGQNDETLYDKMEEREVTMDMYTDDRYATRTVEDPLDAALRFHEMSKSFESLDIDNHSFGEEAEEDVDDDKRVSRFKFENYAFDDMEATEI